MPNIIVLTVKDYRCIIPNTAVFGPTNFIGTIATTTTARGWKRTISTVISFCMQCEVLALAFLFNIQNILFFGF